MAKIAAPDRIGPAGKKLTGAALNSYILLTRQFDAGNRAVFAHAYAQADQAYRVAGGAASRRYWSVTMKAAQAGAADWL